MATKKSTAKTMEDWMTMMEDWFDKLPVLPTNARVAIVKITPWIALIFGILGILAGLAGLGVMTAFSPFVAMSNGFGGVAGTLITAALGLVSAVLLLAGFPGTKARKLQGWKMLFWSEAVSTLASVLMISLTGIVFALIGFYLLFQIKSYYK